MNFFQKIFQKNEKFDSTEFYKYLAILNHLIEVKEKIYTNKKGEKYILTKYGFKPVEQHNLQLLTEQQIRQINNLETDNRVLTKENEELIKVVKKLKSEKQQLLIEKPTVIKYSFKKSLDKFKEKYEALMRNNHFLISKIREKKIKIQQLKNEVVDQKGKYKILQKEINRSENIEIIKDKDELLQDLSDMILYAENKQIEKIFRKVKRITEHQEDLKLKSFNQKAQITNLENQNKQLQEELKKLKNGNT